MEKDIIQKKKKKSRDARCFFAELALALTIPSVCSRYGLNDKVLKGQKESTRYLNWYNKYVYPPIPIFNW